MPDARRNGMAVYNAGKFTDETLPCVVIIQEGGKQEERVRGVAGGKFHSLAVTESGRVFSWGLNVKQLWSLTEEQLEQRGNTVPMRFRGDLEHHRIRSVTAEKYRSGAVTENGTVYVWGVNSLGKFEGYDGVVDQYEFEPRLVQGILNKKHVISISMNLDGTTLAVTNDGWVYKLHVLLQSHGIRLARTTVDLLVHHSRS